MNLDKRAKIITRLKYITAVLLIIFAVILVGAFTIMAIAGRSFTVFILGIIISALALLPLFIQYVVFEAVERLTYNVKYSLKLIKKYKITEEGEA